MDHISAISVFLGAFSILLLLSIRVFPPRWAKMYADASRKKGRPAWAWLAMLGSMALIAAMWMLHFIESTTYSLVISLVGTFVLATVVQALWSKNGLRRNVRMLIQGEVRGSFLPYTIAGIVLIILGLL
ncbi:MAG: hypothetical protein LUQ09_06715 [Methanomassiliicoccales archaeon]|nr:hypothetical protein [Methanomassiliicoccales archaeon]